MNVFEEIRNREQTRSVKWDMRASVFGTDNVLPMWIADMDFPAPDIVNERIIERAKHGIYGYTIIDDKVRDAVKNWQFKRHQWSIDPQAISFTPSVVASLHIAIQALTNKGDNILIQTPVYTPFFNVIKQHGRQIIESPLVLKDGRYEIDFAHFEEKISSGIKAFILCSPHNPVGRVWTEEELREIARLCLKYDVTIISDEIHGDLVYEGHKHIPIASLSDDISQHVVTCTSPTKTFNLAGLQVSYMITENKSLKKTIDETIKLEGFDSLNTFGIVALEAAYEGGEQWLSGLIDTLMTNQNYFIDAINSQTDKLNVIRSEGTYLNWIDCSNLGLSDQELSTFMTKEAKVGLNRGSGYGSPGEQFMRINIACPHQLVKESADRIIRAIQTL